MRRKISAIILLLFLLISTGIYANTKKPEVSKFSRHFVVNYSQREYGDSCAAQNWSVAQAHDGIMYFGNAFRVLEFDGVNWNNTRTTINSLYVTALMAGTNGNVYVGANNEFGYLKNNKFGAKEYISISDSLSLEDSYFSNIWRIYDYNNKVLFFAQEKIFLWDGENLDIINPQTSFHLAFVLDEQLYVRQRGIGLMKYSNDEFVIVNKGDKFKDFGVFGIFPFPDKEACLIITQEAGFFKMQNNKKIIPVNTPYYDYLNSAGIIGGILLHDGNIALNTLRNGVIIIDFEGNIKTIIDQNSGLRDNEIKQVYQDNNNQLWLAHNSGVSMVSYNSTLQVYDFNTGLFGNYQSVAVHNNSIFAGTTIGLFKKNVIPSDRIFQHFKQVEGFNAEVKKLLSVNDYIVIGSPEGLYAWGTNTGVFKIADIDATAIYWSEKSNRLFVSGNDGLFIFTSKPKWQMVAAYEELAIYEPLGIAENLSNPYESSEIWIGTLNDGVWQLFIEEDYSYDFELYIGRADGLGSSWVKPLMFDNEVLFGLPDGLMRFVDEKEIISSLPDSLQEESTNIRGYFEFYNIPGKEEQVITHLLKKFNKVWLSANYRIYFGDDLDNLSHFPFQTMELGRIFDIQPADSATIWLATDDGLAKVNTTWRDDYAQNPLINLRKIVTRNDSVLFHSYSHADKELSKTLPYSLNEIRFHYSSQYNENGFKALYSYKLQGFDTEWSEWSVLSNNAYFNLREGDYTFKVKAKDPYDNESEIIKYEFRILPPWYRTSWAYILYGISALLLVLLIVKLSIMRLKAKNIQLEKIIEKRTEEIRKQKDEIANQHKIVVQQKEAITSSIRYASRIQNALVPQEEYLKEFLPESFIFWIPRDIVSGDFYWIKHSKPYISIVAADCTGHGVPGAFMSMLGIAFLNELAQREKPGEVASVLEHLRNYIKNTLGQTGSVTEQKDGMVMAFCTLNTETLKLYFAGANTPLWIYRDNELIEYKPTKNPIGIHLREVPFEANQIQMKKNDVVYMFSDGYVDQFGGDEGKKFGKRMFREYLLSIHHLPLEEQKKQLGENLKKWMRDEYTQLDDILVMAFKV